MKIIKYTSIVRNSMFLCSIALAVLAGSLCYWVSGKFPAHIYLSEKLMDTYFSSDLPRSYENMISRQSNFWATFKHPLVGLIFLPGTKTLTSIFGATPKSCVRLYLSMNVFVWTLSIFTCLSKITAKCLDSFIYTVFALCSASTIFWFAAPETFAFGSTTILVALTILVYDSSASSFIAHFFANICSAAITITNWMAGIIVSFVSFTLRKALLILLSALLTLMALSSLQRLLVPSSTFLLDSQRVKQEMFWVVGWQAVPLHLKLKSLLIDPIGLHGVRTYVVMKNAYPTPWGRWPPNDRPLIRSEDSFYEDESSVIHPPVSTYRYTLFVISWSVLFVGGLFQMMMKARIFLFHRAVLLCLLGQLTLHFFYNVTDNFLYAPHWAPLMILCASAGSGTRFRIAYLITCCFLVGFLLFSNIWLFKYCLDLLESFRPFA